jgi:hypothetical protein
MTTFELVQMFGLNLFVAVLVALMMRGFSREGPPRMSMARMWRYAAVLYVAFVLIDVVRLLWRLG